MPEPDYRKHFEAEVSRLLNRLYGTALRLTRNGADAEDLVAEALAKAWGAISTLQDRQSFEKWIFRILVNSFISDRRRKRPQTVEPPAGDMDAEENFSLFAKLHQPFLLWWGNPEQSFINKLLREDIQGAIDGLPDTYRIVFILVEVEGFTYGETAECINVPIGTVRSRLNRARSQLQRRLWDQAQQLGLETAAEKEQGNGRSNQVRRSD